MQVQRSLVIPMLALALSACRQGNPLGASVPPSIDGRLESLDASRRVMTTATEIGQGATVSLIDPSTGNTVSTTVTTPSGAFSLSFSNSFRPGQGPYFLEAVKGLQAGGTQNRAGAVAARLRTLLSYQGSRWLSLTAGGITINRSATALCAIGNLKAQLSPPQVTNADLLNLLGTLTVGQSSTTSEGLTCPDTFSGTSAISSDEFHRAWDLVDRALSQDSDPIAALFIRPSTATSSVNTSLLPGSALRPGFGMSQDGWVLTSTNPTIASHAAPTTITLYGLGLPYATSSVTVTLAGVSCPVTAASTTGTNLTFQVPAGIAVGSYPLVVTYGPWTNSQALNLSVQ